jgi:hypothetical protein
MRRRTYAVSETVATTHERPWWQACNVNEFKERIEGMLSDDARALMSEIKGAIAVISITVQNRDADPEQRSRARAALGFTTQKRRALEAYVNRPTPDATERRNSRSRVAAQEARAALERGDIEGAVTRLVEWLEYFGVPNR